MEQRIKPFRGHSGYMLITVLIITAIGLLFGAGALLLFKFQCQLRIEGQHESEKVYAVRSVLNYIKNSADKINSTGKTFEFFTKSERNLNVIAKPVKRIFPDFNNSNHLDIGNEGGNNRYFLNNINDQINGELDYEYGASGVTNVNDGIINNNDGIINNNDGIINNKEWRYGLGYPDLEATNATWWVNIGMRNTGGWLEEEYGRRYYFEPQNFVGDASPQKDTIRLCIIRDVTNNSNAVGCKLGWPLSVGERAIVFQVTPKGGIIQGNDESNVSLTLSEWFHTENGISITNNINWDAKMPAINLYMGVQIAADNVTLFYSEKGGDKEKSGYVFSPGESKLTSDTYNYFAEGIQTNGNKVVTPDLRAVFEVETTATERPYVKEIRDNNFLTNFGVVPAYQFDILIEHPENTTNLATVAQRIMTAKGQGRGIPAQFTVRTYDTHGTENKGFRKDEKLARENKGRTP